MATHASTWALDAKRASSPPGPEEQKPRWSWRAGTIAGVRIYVHATFLVLFAWIGISHLVQGHGFGEAFAGVALILAVFGIVVLHELGHALPERPREELLVALAGPAVNVVLGALFFAASALAHHEIGLGGLHLVGGSFLAKLAWVNVSLAVFNLLPAFPMDGGRVLRAALAIEWTAYGRPRSPRRAGKRWLSRSGSWDCGRTRCSSSSRSSCGSGLKKRRRRCRRRRSSSG